MTIYKTLNVEKPHILHEKDSEASEESGIQIPSLSSEPRLSEFYDETDVMKSKDNKNLH